MPSEPTTEAEAQQFADQIQAHVAAMRAESEAARQQITADEQYAVNELLARLPRRENPATSATAAASPG